MIKKCRNCGRVYECNDKPCQAKGMRYKPKRGYNTINCSKKCSKEWQINRMLKAYKK